MGKMDVEKVKSWVAIWNVQSLVFLLMFLVMLFESKLWTVEGHLAESKWREAVAVKCNVSMLMYRKQCGLQSRADVMSYLHTLRKSSDRAR